MEEWRDVVGYEGLYRVSNKGEVLSVERTKLSRGRKSFSFVPQRVLKLLTGTRGYVYARLCKDGVAKNTLLHRVVVSSFIRPITPAETVNHINGKKSDNSLENLEIVTLSENIQHALRTGLRNPRRGRNPNAKLTESDVIRARELIATNSLSHREIGLLFGVKGPAIWKIAQSRSWAG